jgi:catalase
VAGKCSSALHEVKIADLHPSQFEAQIMDEEDQLRFGFDLLDPTKIVPEEYKSPMYEMNVRHMLTSYTNI